MQGRDDTKPKTTEVRQYAGKAALLGTLAIVLILIGVVLVAMLQAPVVQPRVIVVGIVLVVAGLLLLPIAWLGRHGRS